MINTGEIFRRTGTTVLLIATASADFEVFDPNIDITMTKTVDKPTDFLVINGRNNPPLQ